jgi:hypothetical protein
MKRGALLDLLIRPVTIIQVAVFAPIAVLLLFFAAALQPSAAVAAVSIACAGFGLFVGQAIRVAARCVFAWTLPAFRRALLREFVVGGIAVSGVATAIGVLGGGGIERALVLFAVGFGSFSVGAVYFLAPDWTQLLTLAYILAVPWFMAGRSAAAAVVGVPLVTVAISGAVSALVPWGTFSRGAFRWSALTGPGQAARSIWQDWPMLVRWRRPRARSTRAAASAPAPARYVGNPVVGGVLANYRAIRPLTWLALPVVWLLCLAVFRTLVFDDGRVNPFTAFWVTLQFIWWTGASRSRRSECQAMLPRSRRQHAAVAYASDLGDALFFLGLLLASAAIVGALGGMGGAVLRGLAVMAIFFPAGRWLSGPPVGERWKAEVVVGVLGLLGVMAFLVMFRTVVNHLPKLVSSGATQAVVLGSLVLLSQVLHWRGLRRYLMTRDLVGGSTSLFES